MSDLFDIGDEVLCVNDTIKPEALEEIIKDVPNWIKKGETYFVREVLHNDDIAPALLLEGVHNPPVYFHLLGRVQEPGFATWRFVKQASAEEHAELDEEIDEGIDELKEILEEI